MTLGFVLPWVWRSALVAAGYVLAGWWGLQMPYAGSYVTLVWLPTGIAVAALWYWGLPMAGAIALAVLVVSLLVGAPPWLALGIAVGNTLAPLATVAALRQLGFQPAFERRRDVGVFVLCAAAGMAVSALSGTLCLQMAGLVVPGEYFAVALAWWMGDTVGVLLAAPLLWRLRVDSFRVLAQHRVEGLLWLVLALPTLWAAFGMPGGIPSHAFAHGLPLAFLTLPLLVWAALRFGGPLFTLVALGFSLAAVWGTARGTGSFYLEQAHVGQFLLWCYIATLALMGLLIAALTAERTEVETVLRHSEAKLRGLYELAPLGIALTSMQGRYIEFNESFRAISGYTAQELNALDYWELTPKRYAAQEAAQLESLKRTGYYGPYEKEYQRKDGTLVPWRLHGMLITGENGEPMIWSIVEDISDRQRAESDLRIAATAFEAQVGILVTDVRTRILRVNQALCEDTGYSADELVGLTPRVFKSGRHDAVFYKAMWDCILQTGSWQGEVWDRRKAGDLYPKWLTITAIRNPQGEVSHYVSTQVNITQRKAAEDEVRNLAFYDPLTHLPNRRLLQDRLHQALATLARGDRHGALLFIDLDNFKALNDTWGHTHGDTLLQGVAQRLQSHVRQGDTVARLGGDEFVVVLEDLASDQTEAAAQAQAIASKLRAALDQVHEIDGNGYHSSASIGVVLFDNQPCGSDALMRHADMAMYQAKNMGRNAVVFFDPSMQAAVQQRVQLESELRSALAAGQFVLHYQAQVGRNGHCCGAEALVRWQHPVRGLVFPDGFIAFAEETQLIVPLGRWVLEQACRQLAAWSTRPTTAQWTVSVNVSARQVHQEHFVQDVLDALRDSGAKPQQLTLELTESLLLDDADAAVEKMLLLRQHGIGFALDDFGTGYSSLSYIQRLPLSTLKIDRSFVRDILGKAQDAAIAKMIVALGQALHLEVLAEGVETPEQRDYLAAIGCHAYQGYFFGKPVPVAHFERDYAPPAPVGA